MYIGDSILLCVFFKFVGANLVFFHVNYVVNTTKRTIAEKEIQLKDFYLFFYEF